MWWRQAFSVALVTFLLFVDKALERTAMAVFFLLYSNCNALVLDFCFMIWCVCVCGKSWALSVALWLCGKTPILFYTHDQERQASSYMPVLPPSSVSQFLGWIQDELKSSKTFQWFENCNFVKTLCILLQVVVSASPVMCLFWRKLLTKFGRHTTVCNHFSLLAATMKCLQFHRKLPALGMCWEANQMGRSFPWFTLSPFYSWSICSWQIFEVWHSFKKHLQWNSRRFRKMIIQLNIAVLHLCENRVDSESDFLTGLQGCGSLH